MLPFLGIRAAVPLGVVFYHLPLGAVFGIGLLGSLVPVVLILVGLEAVVNFLRRISKPLNIFFTWLFGYTRRKHTKHFERFGSVGLFLLAAVPIPGFSGWSAALAAYVFGFSFRFSFLSIALGEAVAGAIIAVIALGGMTLSRF